LKIREQENRTGEKIMLEPRQLYNFTHPFIDSIYLKKEFGPGAGKKGIDVLVIKAKDMSKAVSRQQRDSLLFSFLAELDLIKDRVERKAGKFKRVDIRYC
jgi:hypothetical protein